MSGPLIHILFINHYVAVLRSINFKSVTYEIKFGWVYIQKALKYKDIIIDRK